MKRVFTIRGLAVLLTAFLIMAAGETFAGDKTGLMLDWYPNPDHVPFYVALEKGFFKAEGLDVDIMAPADPSDPLKLVAAGKMDFAVSYQPSVHIARSEKLPVVSIGALVQHPLSSIMYLKSSGFKSPADFKGKKIGYSVEPLYRVLLEAVAEKAGLKKTDYEAIRVGFNLSPQLLAGQVDAVIGAFRNYEAVQVELEGESVGVFPLEENGVPDFYELVLITNEKTVKSDSAKVKAFIRAVSKGIEYTLAHPEEAIDIFVKANKDSDNELTRKSFEATLPFFRGSPAQDPKRWEVMQDFMFERGLITVKSPIEEMIWAE